MFPKLLFTVGVVLFFSAITEMSKGEEPEESEPTECECGIPDPEDEKRKIYVIGGHEVETFSKYPWMVSIQKDGEQHCGGAFISPSVILSAAHCFSKPNAMHALDTHHSTCKTEDGEGPCYHSLSIFSAHGREDSGLSDTHIRRVTVHPEYAFNGNEYDIALIELQKPIKCGKNTRPICLPSEVPELEPGSSVIVAGWGRSETLEGGDDSPKLLEANLTVLEEEECRRHGGDKETHICAKGDGQSACMGDSGGPLMFQISGKFYVYGVVSHGTSAECDPEDPQYYSNVKLFVDWIEENMNEETNSEM